MALAIASVGSLGSAKTGTTFNIGVPAGVTNGALVCVAVMAYNSGSAPTEPTISGFTAGPVSPSAMNAFGLQFKVWWFYKYATGADSGSYAVGRASSNATMGYAFRVSGWVGGGNPFVDSLHEGVADAAAATVASWTPGGDNSLLALIMLDSGANIPPSFTDVAHAVDTDGDTITLGQLVQTAATATGALTGGNSDGTIISVATLRTTVNNYTAVPAENVRMTDVVTASLTGGQQSIGDSVQMTDSVSVTRTAVATVADSMAIADAARAAGPVRFITGVSADGHHFVDQGGNSIMLKGDSPWSAFTDLSVALFDTWCADRAAKGFNAAQVSLLGNVANGAPSNDGATFDGILPFSDTTNFTPNPTYWARIDQFVATAASYGITLFVFPVDGWVVNPTDGVVRTMTLTQAQAYGVWVATRYLSSPNIAWMAGGDYYATDSSSIMQSVLTGLKSVDPNRLNSLEGLYQRTYAREWQNWKNRVTFDFLYSRLPTYEGIRKTYALTPAMPTTLGEGIYDGMYLPDGGGQNSELVCRMQIGWTLTSGGAGDFYGTQDWEFLSGWQTRLDRNSAFQAQYMRAAFEKRAWTKLVPSTTFITSGGGTPYVFPNEPPANTDPSQLQTNDSNAPSSATNPATMHTHTVASASVSADGKIAAVYLPTQRQITVDTTKLAPGATATWVDPLTGNETAGSMSNLTPPAAGDWLLFIESAGTDYAQSPADTLSLTDAASSSTTALRVQTDNVSGADAVAITAETARSLDDPVPGADLLTVAADDVRGPGDPSAISDQANTALSVVRQVDEQVSLTDQVVALVGFDVAVADSVALSDRADYQADLDRRVDDQVGIADSVVAQITPAGNAQLEDGESIADEAAAYLQSLRSASDQERITDHVTAVLSGGGGTRPDVELCGWLEPRIVDGYLGGRIVAGSLDPQEDCW